WGGKAPPRTAAVLSRGRIEASALLATTDSPYMRPSTALSGRRIEAAPGAGKGGTVPFARLRWLGWPELACRASRDRAALDARARGVAGGRGVRRGPRVGNRAE